MVEKTAAGSLAVVAVNAASVTQLAKTVHDELGRVDLLVANAGAMLAAPFATADIGEWDRMLDADRGPDHPRLSASVSCWL
jgi:NADP-dependent 3-hydroxy acid dehydrogenase YdfG